jgi:sec-independent protein translocase protein TatB
MFDIGFWELALIGVVALLVVGPDRLPALARTVGLWVGRIRRYVSTVRDDIEREIQADELKSLLSKTDDLNPLKDIIEETTNTIGEANKELSSARKEADELMSADSGAVLDATDPDDSDDETGADAPTPDSAATKLGEALSTPSDNDVAATSAESPDETVENTEDHEQRPR